MPILPPTDFGDYQIFTTTYDVEENAVEQLAQLEAETPGFPDRLARYLEERAEAVDVPDAPAGDPARPITFLLDLSGSMRGGPLSVTLSALLRVGDALSAAGRPFEILGFTTHTWKGGQSRKDWLAANRQPPSPGRLAELRHIVFKDISNAWAETRLALSYGFLEGLLKENIDGESLVWAVNRGLARVADGSPGPVVVMISDGMPMDDSTLSVNPAKYLQKHLDAVCNGLGPDVGFARVNISTSQDSIREGDIVPDLMEWTAIQSSHATLSGKIIDAIMTGIATASE